MDERVVLDPHPLRELLAIGAPPSLVQDLLRLYTTEVPVRMARLEAALAVADLPAAAVEAHSLKGSTGSLGLLRFMDLAAAVDHQARGGHLDEARALAEGIPGAFQAGLEALRAAFPGP